MEIEQIKNIKINFILTTERTGSTLLSSMLNSHPNVISTIEEPFAYTLYPKYSKIKEWTSKTIQEFCYDFFLFSEGILEVQFGTKMYLEKTLETYKSHLNVNTAIRLTYLCFFPNKEKVEISTVVDKQLKFHFCLDKVAEFYPQSKFIILYRDPRDQAHARYRMSQKKKRKEDYFLIAKIWMFTYGRLNNYLNKIGNSRFLEIKYEDLVTNTEIELNKICSFLNITYNPSMLKYDEFVKEGISKSNLNEDSLKEFTSFHRGITQKIDTDKIDAWKRELKEKEANTIWTVCGVLAEKIGYKKNAQFTKQYKTFKNYLTLISISIKRYLTIHFYYNSPFYIKYLLKKLKYGRKFKIGIMTREDYYETSYHNN